MLKTVSLAGARRVALFAGVGLTALAFAAPAYAQGTPASSECLDANEDGTCDTPATSADGSSTTGHDSAIVVTGSRVRRDEYSTIDPITVVTAAEITQSGFNSAADALQSTEVTQGAAQINNYFGGFVTDGGTGANTLGLRGLGPARTLILLNGRRLAPAGTRGSVLAADLNVLPIAIVDRVEILKAGASSVYGSDAVAGVVNLITKTRDNGLTINAQVNAPQIGAGLDKRISATFGFSNDRFNLVGSLEYRERGAVRLRDVAFAKCPVGGFTTSEGAPFGSDDSPGFDGTTCFTLDNGGVTINTLGVPTRSGIGRTSGAVGNFNRFVPAGATQGGATPGFLGVGTYDRDTFDPASQMEEVVTPVKTYTGFLSGSYDLDMLGDAEVYAEVLATRRQSSSILYRQLSLDYLQGSPLVPEIFRNGVFLSPTNTSSGQNISARVFMGFGNTNSSQEVDYVRAGGGIRGDFFIPGWRYDAYVGKSWTDSSYQIESFLVDRLAASLNAVQNPDGSFRCAAQATLANCVVAPVLNADTIGGRLPAAYRNYILQNTIGTNVFRETTFSAAIDGPLFDLGAGDVQLVIGAEYRKQRIDDTPDMNAQTGNLFGLTASVPTRGTDSVKEVFSEIFVPLLSGRPFFEKLNLNASIRYTDYKSYGSDVTYKVAGEWEFFRGFGIRGSYGTSYRAPALAEQYLGATSGFLASSADPCDKDNFPRANGAPNPGAYTPAQQQRATNCAAQGINVATFDQNSGVTVFNRGGAETGLSAETSRNWSVGAVVQPRISSAVRLSLALDYFDIRVDNGVASLGGSAILSRCYNATDFGPNNGFCRFVQRDANNILTVTSGYVNLSTDIVKGYEFNGRLGFDMFGGDFLVNARVTKYTEQSDRIFPEEFKRDANGTLTTPDWVGSFDASYHQGNVTLRYGLSWTGASKGSYDLLAFSRTTGEVNQALAQSYRDAAILEVKDYFLHSASVQFDVTQRMVFTFGVRNLLNTQPPRITAFGFTTQANAPIYSGYDFIGRSFFANTTFKF